MTRVHLAFPVADLSTSVAFYTALFGEGPDKTRDGYARFAPATAPISLSLTHLGLPVDLPADITHFGVRATGADTVRSAIQRLQAAELVDLIETNEVCCHATQDKVWAVDPDGRRWEVYVITDDAPTLEPSTSTSCCMPASTAPAARSCCA